MVRSGGYAELKQLVTVLSRTVKAQETLTSGDALNWVEVVSDYAYALEIVDKTKAVRIHPIQFYRNFAAYFEEGKKDG